MSRSSKTLTSLTPYYRGMDQLRSTRDENPIRNGNPEGLVLLPRRQLLPQDFLCRTSKPKQMLTTAASSSGPTDSLRAHTSNLTKNHTASPKEGRLIKQPTEPCSCRGAAISPETAQVAAPHCIILNGSSGWTPSSRGPPQLWQPRCAWRQCAAGAEYCVFGLRWWASCAFYGVLWVSCSYSIGFSSPYYRVSW